MISFKFSLEDQNKQYEIVKNKLFGQFYQLHKFYVLPVMPQKFRNRVIFLPEACEPLGVYVRQRGRLEKLENDWNKTKSKFIPKLKKLFPDIDKIKILISPTFYGSVGSYGLHDNQIIVRPRFERSLLDLQKLMVLALTHYFIFKRQKLDKSTKLWSKKQSKADEISSQLFKEKSKTMLKILDTEFAGRLAEESTKYLEKLKVESKTEINKPSDLTKSENEVFNLLLRSKNKLVSFEEISEWLWKDKSDERYSEYAITKLIERLKKKLPKNSIHNQRGIGYLLHT